MIERKTKIEAIANVGAISKSKKTADILDYYVAKSNVSIWNTSYDLSLIEQKILLFLITKIKQEDTEFHMYLFDISLFLKICGKSLCGKNYKDIKRAIENLHKKEMFINANPCTLAESFIDRPIWDNQKGNVVVKLNNNLRPYFLELRSNYTQYKIKNILLFDSKYAIRIYELAKSVEFKKKTSIDVDYLKIQLNCTNYSNWNTFEKKVLSKAIEQINELSDIKISYSIDKRCKKKVTEISMTVENIEIKKQKILEEYRQRYEKVSYLFTKVS